MFNLKKANRVSVRMIDALNRRLDPQERLVFLVKNVETSIHMFSSLEKAIDFIENSNKFEFYANKYFKNTTIHCFIKKGDAHKNHCSKMELFRDIYKEEKYCPQVLAISSSDFINDKSISMENVTVNF